MSTTSGCAFPFSLAIKHGLFFGVSVAAFGDPTEESRLDDASDEVSSVDCVGMSTVVKMLDGESLSSGF